MSTEFLFGVAVGLALFPIMRPVWRVWRDIFSVDRTPKRPW